MSLGVALATCVWAAPSMAGDTPAAQALFDHGRKLMSQQRYAEACEKFEESERLDPALGTLLNLANCREQEGKLATAWSAFLDFAAKATAAGQKDRARLARERAAALAPRLSKITVTVADRDAASSVEIRRDGTIIGPGQLGTEVPVDPGKHAISASAPGKQPWSTSVEATEGQTSTVAVPSLTQLPSEPHVAPAPVASAPPPAPADMRLTDARASSSLGTQRVVALVTAGVGVIGIGVGSAFGAMAISKHGQAWSACSSATCPEPHGSDLWHDAVVTGNVATVALAGGAVAVAAGAVLWWTAKAPAADAPGLKVGIGYGTVRLRGTW